MIKYKSLIKKAYKKAHGRDFINSLDITTEVCVMAMKMAVNNWREVKKGLPEIYGFYLISAGQDVYVASFQVAQDGNRHFFVPHEKLSITDKITHWMPLPAPPKSK